MSYMCDNCGKVSVMGRSQRHGRGVAGKRWRKRAQKTARMFRPNLQKISLLVSGKSTQMFLCTSCIKRFKKDGKIKSYSKSVASV